MVARDRSRSPYGQADDVMELIIAREQARQNKDFDQADSIREQLKALGVTLFDKTRGWTAEDGRTGRIPSFAEIEAGTAENLDVETGDDDPDDPETAQIRDLVRQREQARAAKDFDKADQVREELKALGVDLHDKEKMWRSKSGACGVIIGYLGAKGITELEISTLVVQREKARQGNDYTTADVIRRELKRHGVQIMDKQKVWRTRDGKSGPVPSWDAITGAEDGAGQKFAAVASRQVAMGNNFGGGGDLQSQNAMLRQALAEAQAQLQAVQRGGGARVMVRPSTAPQGMRPVVGGGKGAAAPARGRHPQEVTNALSYMASVAGRRASDADISWLVELREKMRMAKDFGSSDALRDGLRTHIGVELMEKEKRWAAADGRQGAIPLWSTISG